MRALPSILADLAVPMASVAAFAGLVACVHADAARPWEHERALPAECQQDLSWLDVEVRDLPRAEFALRAMPDARGRTWMRRDYGYWKQRLDGKTWIEIDETLGPVQRAITLHHERCHELRYRLTGSPDWPGHGRH